jgi:hypothetical protein
LKKGFNLLKSQAEPPSVWSKLYEWVLGSARIIIILVEIVVLIAFGFKVWVDIQGKELDKSIERSEAIVNAMATSEKEYRLVQAKTSSYKTIWDASIDYSKLLENINSILPITSSIKDITVSFDKEQISISGISPKSKESEIKNLENDLKNNSPFLKDTVLAKLDDTQTQLKFLFTAKLINLEKKSIDTIVTDGSK